MSVSPSGTESRGAYSLIMVKFSDSVIARIAAWSCFGLVAYLSLLPASLAWRSGSPDWLEHLVAYAGTSMAFSFAYTRFPRLTLAALLCVYAALLEGGQSLAPGRTAELTDFVAGGCGAFLGVLVAHGLMRLPALVPLGLKLPAVGSGDGGLRLARMGAGEQRISGEFDWSRLTAVMIAGGLVLTVIWAVLIIWLMGRLVRVW